MTMDNKIIYSLASAKGRAGVSVVRMSGEGVGDILSAITKRPLPESHTACVRELVNPNVDEHSPSYKVDKALVLFMRGPNSFTGEDVVEFHIHGGTAVQAALFEVLDSFDDVRVAEPGEFSRRAFEHGKLDLTEAEGINDLVLAETEAQRVQALRQMEGSLGQLYESWRSRLLKAQALFEANIDFSDEDIPEELEKVARPEILAVLDEVKEHLHDHKRGQMLRTGFQVVIVGKPNVGKSSLLNMLAKDDVAIVSQVAGTTRDTISVRLDLGGYLVTITDTAGIRESDDEIEQEGVRRALSKAAQSDLKIIMLSAIDGGKIPSGLLSLIEDDGLENSILVVNKIDLPDAKPDEAKAGLDTKAFYVSAKSGEGFDGLLEAISTIVEERMSIGDTPSITRARHREHLENFCQAIDRFLNNQTGDPALLAEDIRMGIRELGKITGRVDVEDMLDIIFGEFCIGK